MSNFNSSNFLEYLVDLVFPKESEFSDDIHSFLSQNEMDNFSLTTKKQIQDEYSLYIKNIYICGRYEHSSLENLLHRAKFGGELSILDDLAIFVDQKTKQADLLLPELISFIPSDPVRIKKRSYHLPKILAQKLAKIWNLPLVEMLQKTKHTESQVKLSVAERKKNLTDLFVAKNNLNLTKYTNIWLIDDVCTTGTTIYESAKAIRNEYPFLQICGLVVAG